MNGHDRLPSRSERNSHDIHGEDYPELATGALYRAELSGDRCDDQPRRGGMDQLLWALLQVQIDQVSGTADQSVPGEIGPEEVQTVSSCLKEGPQEAG
ncbi:hypothetical protein OHA27_38755 [Streptomyces sp. NBC_01619]|nr:hypothetical protein [Streptomyces sp. NBC_01619]MCX4516032.1 hypothetical protein [Streptomyces sp. NBC_01619]